MSTAKPCSFEIESIKERLAPSFDDERGGFYPGDLDHYAYNIQDLLLQGYSWDEAVEEINYSTRPKLMLGNYVEW